MQSQLALHTSTAILCAHLQVVALHFSRKTFHRLALPNLALVCLQSLAITLIRCQLCIASLASPTHVKKRNAPLTIWGFASPPRLAHAHMQRKETYFAPPIPKHCANGSCHQGLWFLHTSRVYDLALIIRLSMHGALLGSSSHKKGESSTTRCDHATTAATPRLPSMYATGKYTQVCAKVSQCSSTLHSYLSPFEYSLMHTTFTYFLVCSGFSLALGIFNQMRLRVKLD